MIEKTTNDQETISMYEVITHIIKVLYKWVKICIAIHFIVKYW